MMARIKATPPKASPKKPRAYAVGSLPSREAVLEAMAREPGIDGKRDLAKYFGIKGDMRTPFKMLLKEMEGDGLIARRRKQIRPTAMLPAVTVLDIPADADPDNMHASPPTGARTTAKSRWFAWSCGLTTGSSRPPATVSSPASMPAKRPCRAIPPGR